MKKLNADTGKFPIMILLGMENAPEIKKVDCPKCNGTGKINDAKCSGCNGTGEVRA